MIDLGDFPANHTAVCIPWDSFASATGAPSATTNFAAADIQIYKDGGTTQRSSSNGITVSTSFDGSVGLQMIVIDLSDNTDAGFYAAGHEYQVAVADVTIDSQTVRFWAGTFSIERAGGILALLKATGSVKVDVVKWNSQTVPTPNINGVPLVDLKYLLGTIFATPATAGILDINVKNINNVATATPGAAGGVFIAGLNAATTVNITGNLTGNVSGSVGNVTGAVGSVTGLTASDVGAIKTQTDKLTFTVANQVDANTQYVNDVQVNGVGSAGNPWGP